MREPTATPVPDRRSDATAVEDVLIRNHDFQWGYDLELTVVTTAGDPVFASRYYLMPGEARSEVDVYPLGTYLARVVLDNRRTVSVEFAAADGLLVELGNGTVSLRPSVIG